MEQTCVFQVVRVSGTIRKSEEEAIRRAKASILQAHRAAGGGQGGAQGGMLERILRGREDDGDVGRKNARTIEDDEEDEEEEDEDED